MSNEQEQEPFDRLLGDLSIDTDKIVSDNDLDLKTAGRRAVEDLARYRANRKDIVLKRAALKEAQKRLDKRILIALDTLKTIGTPS